MKNIFNPYLSSDDKDILFMMMEVEDATIPDSTELWNISTAISATVPGQIGTVAEPVSASG